MVDIIFVPTLELRSISPPPPSPPFTNAPAVDRPMTTPLVVTAASPLVNKNLVSDRNRPRRIYKIRYCVTPVHLPRGQVYIIILWVQLTYNRGPDIKSLQLYVGILLFRLVPQNRNQNHTDSVEICIVFIPGG